MKRMDIHQNQTTVAKKDPLPSCCRSIWNTFSHAAWPFKSSDGSHIEMRRHQPRSSPKPSMPVRFVFFAPGRAPVGPIKSRHWLTVQYCIEMPVRIQWSIPQILDAPHGRKDQDGHCLTVRVLENLISHVRDRDTVYFHRRIFH